LPYIPLHVHSTNSPGTGMMTASEIAGRAAFLGLPAVGLTDHWNTYGHFELAKAAASSGIKAVLGAELRHLSLTGHDGLYHLTVLAEDNEGYADLTRLVSLHHEKEGEPHVTVDELSSCGSGLIALSGCIHGETSRGVLQGNLAMQRDAAGALREIFGKDRFYLELMTHNEEHEQLVMDKTVLLSEKLNIPLVVTNNDRYLRKEEAEYYGILRELSGNRGRAETEEYLQELYMKERKELEPYFYFLEGALDASGEIAERCRVDLISGTTVTFPSTGDANLDLAEKCNRRFSVVSGDEGSGQVNDLKNRMMSELEIASVEEVSGFLLFLEKMFRRCRRSGEWIELLGGGLCESIVAWLLGLVPLNPAEHGLMVETFGAPAPGVPPVLELLRSRGPRERFMSIIRELLPGFTFHFQLQREDSSFVTLVRELGIKLDLAEQVAEELAQAVSTARRGSSLAGMLESSESITHIYNSDKNARRVLHAAAALQGRVSRFVHNTSRIVVLPPEAAEKVASVRTGEREDFLMLDTEAISAHGGWMLVVQQSHYLTALAGTIAMIRTGRETEHPEEWKPKNVNDAAAFDLIASGETDGVYLLASRGIRDLLTKIMPGSFDELVNVISLYRPAPLEGRLWQRFVENMHREVLPVVHRSLAPSLEGTNGLLLYREQVREILLSSGGISGREAVFVERALGSQNASDLQSARLMFIRGALEKGIDEEDAQKIFDFLLHNIGYTYDRTYSCTQAYISYRSAFLKAHHTQEYFAALLEASADNRDRKRKYLEYLMEKGPAVFPPDVNLSGRGYSAEENTIRAPMAERCDMTVDEVDTVVEERKTGVFSSIDDFLERLSGKLAMETVMNMAGSGLFDSFGIESKALRDEVLAFFDEHAKAGEFFRRSNETKKPRKSDDGQMSLFDD